MTGEISIRHDLRSGDLGRIISLHGESYDSLPGFGLRFEAYVARTVAEYVLDNASRGRIWMAERHDELIGCTAIVLREDDLAQLRWVLVAQSARGLGLGRKFVDRAIGYCREQSCHTIFLETTDGLPESQALYEKLGFTVTANEPEKLWDGVRPLIRMELAL